MPAYFEGNKALWAARNPIADFSSDADARGAVAQLDVFFESFNYEEVREKPALNTYAMLANIGGTLGLYGGLVSDWIGKKGRALGAGLSFLTLFEFLELCYRWTFRVPVEGSSSV